MNANENLDIDLLLAEAEQQQILDAEERAAERLAQLGIRITRPGQDTGRTQEEHEQDTGRTQAGHGLNVFRANRTLAVEPLTSMEQNLLARLEARRAAAEAGRRAAEAATLAAAARRNAARNVQLAQQAVDRARAITRQYV